MISLKISDIKLFMAKLLASSSFDQFILREMELQTFTVFSISGQFNEDFFTNEELEERKGDRCVLWSDVRSIAYSMIKGNKTPLALKIIFQLPRQLCEDLVHQFGGKLRMEDIGGLYINLRFEKKELHIITGTAIKTFTLDKTLEQEWDREVRSLLKDQGVAFEEE